MSKVLTGSESRKALRSQNTKNKCGYFEMMRIEDQIRWFVWDHREELWGIRLNSEEACRKWLL